MTCEVPRAHAHDQGVVENGREKLGDPEEAEDVNGYLPFKMFLTIKINAFEL